MKLQDWPVADLLLHVGEMTAQEKRTVYAVLAYIDTTGTFYKTDAIEQKFADQAVRMAEGMRVTAEKVRAVRNRADAPLMQCKAALVKCDGDIDKAVELLRTSHVPY